MNTRELADAFSVSERLIRQAHDVQRLRPDLGPEVEAGRMTVHEAHRLATRETRVTLSALVPADIAAAVDEVADISGASRSDVVRAALAEYIERRRP